MSTFHISIECLSVKDDIYEMTYQPLKMNMISHSKLQGALIKLLPTQYNIPRANWLCSTPPRHITPTATAILNSHPHPTPLHLDIMTS
jgi:hypothetical protein